MKWQHIIRGPTKPGLRCSGGRTRVQRFKRAGVVVLAALGILFVGYLAALSPASWSLDSEASGFEKMESGINARAVDYVRFGLVFLHDGFWNGAQILPKDWVRESTTPDCAWSVALVPGLDSYYKYHSWGIRNGDGTYDFFALGKYDQIVYVAPRRRMVVVRLGGRPHGAVSWPLVIHSLVDQVP